MSKFVKLAAVLAAGVVALGSAANAKTLRLNHNNPEDHPLHKSMEFMAERLEEATGGDLKIRIYANAQLGTQRE
ncbi:MAG: TRAP transporter substrate-binding protein, partial [Roseibium sp.]|nr:TRAP transporter substrate-binding protein [Roseibium sp.]